MGSLSDLIKIASKRGGLCLSKKYFGSHHKLKWRCRYGHTWKAAPTSVRRGSWCPVCAGKIPLTLKQMKEIASKQGGYCLSKQYQNNRTPLLWQCRVGHRWHAQPASIKGGYWCPYCAGNKRLTIEEMKRIAIKRGGKCLSDKYKGSHSRLKWQCKKGHRWKAQASSVKQGTWCPICAGKGSIKYSDVVKLARERGGRLLSKKIISTHKPIKWRCQYGHIWSASLANVRFGTWCPVCRRKSTATKLALGLAAVKIVARARGGKCLSEKYTNANEKLEWKCKYGHIWESPTKVIRRGAWCPICSERFGERYCRVIFEKLFKKRFTKVRPSWLINNNGFSMELDGYNEELKLAFEHQGVQHYQITPLFMVNRVALRRRIQDDRRKHILCKQKGIVLIAIPEIGTKLPVDQAATYIAQECIKSGRMPKIDVDSISIDPYSLYRPANDSGLKEARTLARKQGGKLLSTGYTTATAKMEWQCKKGHTWEAKIGAIRSGNWCPFCSGRRKTDDYLGELAIQFGGRAISKKYISSRSRYRWKCARGHYFDRSIVDLQRNCWCPHCAKEDRLKQKNKKMEAYLSQLKDRCKEMKATIIQGHPKTLHDHVIIRCTFGHISRSPLGNILRGRWCRKCSAKLRGQKRRKYGIEDAHKIARERGGICLSKDFQTVNDKLRWKCKYGHPEWMAPLTTVLRLNTWCPVCAGNARLSIDEVKTKGKKLGFLLLSNSYKNCDQKLRWRCLRCGFEYESSLDTVRSGKRKCRKCRRTQ